MINDKIYDIMYESLHHNIKCVTSDGKAYFGYVSNVESRADSDFGEGEIFLDIDESGGLCIKEGNIEDITILDEMPHIRAHEFSSNHKPELEKDSLCGCFSCLKIFHPREIKEWIIEDTAIDWRGTAICPYCSADSVIGESSGYPITKKFLEKMRNHWF